MCANGWIKSKRYGRNMMTDNELYIFNQLEKQLEFARKKIEQQKQTIKELNTIIQTLSAENHAEDSSE